MRDSTASLASQRARQPELHPCLECGQPTSAPGLCSFCRMLQKVNPARLRRPADSIARSFDVSLGPRQRAEAAKTQQKDSRSTRVLRLFCIWLATCARPIPGSARSRNPSRWFDTHPTPPTLRGQRPRRLPRREPPAALHPSPIRVRASDSDPGSSFTPNFLRSSGLR